jgi:hypothetical protein
LRFEQSLQAVGQAGAFVHNAAAMKDQWLDGARGAVLRRACFEFIGICQQLG